MGTVATVSIGANSYTVYGITSNAVSDANSYFAAHVNATEWTSANATRKTQALVSAFRMLEREDWDGEKLVDGQTTQFPRTGLEVDDETVPDGTPDRLVHGQFELALYLLRDASTMDKTSTASNVQSVGAGSARVTFFYPLPGSATKWPLPVWDLLSPFLAGSSDTSVLEAYVGEQDGSPDFTIDDATRSQGFA